MSEEINYSELRKSMIAGCDAYLKARENNEYLPGFYHGAQGLTRALKAKTQASSIVNDTDQDHFLLLALLLAIFNSSSKGLAMCIVAQFIQGNIVAFGAHDNDYISEPAIMDNDFTSKVFSKDLLYKAATSIPMIEIADSPFGPVMGVDKKSCVHLILNSQAPKDAFFKPLTKQFTADLNKPFSRTSDTQIYTELMSL